jgi:hypothetical protein
MPTTIVVTADLAKTREPLAVQTAKIVATPLDNGEGELLGISLGPTSVADLGPSLRATVEVLPTPEFYEMFPTEELRKEALYALFPDKWVVATKGFLLGQSVQEIVT